MADDDSISCQGFLSQGTLNVMLETMDKNTPPEPPITRTKKEHISEKDIKVTIPDVSYSIKNIKERYKVTDYRGRKLIYLPRDAMFRVKLAYTKQCTDDLYVRIYPSSSDCAYKFRPIKSCSTHGLKVLTKVGSESLDKAMKSIFEVHDPDVEYQYLDLFRNEVQVSALARFCGPEMGLDLAIKCYNSCQESFKKIYPKLNFAIERCVGDKKYLVLSEVAIYFKVCASPARDCKSMTLKKRPAPIGNGAPLQEQPSKKPLLVETVANGDFEPYYVDINDKRYCARLVTKEMWAVMESVQRNFGPPPDEDSHRKIELIEREISSSLIGVVSALQATIHKQEPVNH